MDCYAIVLAAGKGTRMKSRRNDVSKVAYPLLGKPMVSWVVDAVKPLADKGVVTVVGFAGESVERIVSNVAKVVWQREQKGTGDAVKCAKEWFEGKEGCTIIVPGDRPLLQEKTLAALLSAHEANHDVMTVLSVVSDAALPGKIVKEQGRVVRIAKTKGDPEAKASKEINLGVYVIDNRELFSTLATLEPGLGGEYHLADLAEAFSHQGKKVSSFVLADPLEGYGVNDRLELSAASAVLQERINAKWMRSGVTIEDPRTAYIAPEAKIGPDTVIRPNTHIYGESKIGENNVLGPDSYFDRVEIGDDNVIEYCHLVETKVGNKTTLGPWLRARKNAVIHDEAHIGNFNEPQERRIRGRQQMRAPLLPRRRPPRRWGERRLRLHHRQLRWGQ